MTTGPPPSKSKARVLAGDVFLNGAGAAAKVYVGCLGGQGCSGKVVVRDAKDGTVLAKRKSYGLGRNDGALLGAALTRRWHPPAWACEAREARGRHQGHERLRPEQDGDRPPARTDAKARGAEREPRRREGFSTPAGDARVWLGCLGPHQCEGKLKLFVDGTRVAKADYSSPPNSAKLVRLALDSQATDELGRAGRLKVEARASNKNGHGDRRKLVILESG